MDKEPEKNSGGVTVSESFKNLEALIDPAEGMEVENILAAAVAELKHWRSGGVTEEMLRAHDGCVRLNEKVSMVATEYLEDLINYRASAIALARAEFKYWSTLDDPDGMTIAATGACANIVAGLLLGKSMR